VSAVSTEPRTAVTAERRSSSGELLGQVELDATIFGVGVNVPLLHQVITAQLAARRAGTQSTKTRAEVKGGSAKPFRQKGTGNARQGSIRAPHYSGGGVALGPKPRSYAQRTPRKMIQQALRCALSDRASEGRVTVVDRWAFEAPKTKDAAKYLGAAGCSGTVLLVIGRDDVIAARSFANIPDIATLPADQLSAYDVLAADYIVFTDATLPGESSEVAASPKPKRATKAKAAVEPEAAAEPEVATAEAATEPVGDDAASDEESN
jgi:large subunit ribosomal protein L4